MADGGRNDRRFLVALNLDPTPHALDLVGAGRGGRVVLSAHRDRDGEPVTDARGLRGDEGVVVARDA